MSSGSLEISDRIKMRGLVGYDTRVDLLTEWEKVEVRRVYRTRVPRSFMVDDKTSDIKKKDGIKPVNNSSNGLYYTPTEYLHRVMKLLY